MHFFKFINAAIMAAFILLTNSAQSQTLSSLLPKNNEIESWKLSDSLVEHSGDQLFNYIDGGAEIFMEYGFKKVVSAPYQDSANRQLQVEIYEMSDPDAAFGTYTFYLNGPGEKLNIQQEAIFLDYYGAAWKGNILVVVSTPGGDITLKKTIHDFLKNVAEKHSNTATKPELVNKIEKSKMNVGHIKYIEGKVGLSNIYKFIPGNAFSFNKGIAFDTQTAKIVALQYEKQDEAKKALNEALQKFKNSNTEAVFTNTENAFSYTDYKNYIISCKAEGNYLITVISKENAAIETNENDVLKVLAIP